jgi:50S ribosomal subunit-associated GTPase HflX
VADKPRLTLLNKVDRLSRRDGSPLRGLEDLVEYELSLSVHRPDACLVSALLGWGLGDVLARIEEVLFGGEATAASKGAARQVG